MNVEKPFLILCIAIGLLTSCGNETYGDELAPQTYTATWPCENGMADIYPCNGYDLMSYMSLQDLTIEGVNSGSLSGNDSWGWTDPTTNKEYALVGLNSHAAFVDISNPVAPLLIGVLPTATVNSSWRDIKVYQDHAFIVSEAPGHGMQVFDLTRLKNVSNAPEIFTADSHFTDFGQAHNIVINESSGYAYVVGANRNGPFSGGALFINIQNPAAPISEGGFAEGGYSHDAQVVNYSGPDVDYTGKEILVGSNETEIVIADVSDKANPITISTIAYSNIGYTHQGWFTEDLIHFIVGDEKDELNIGTNTRTLIFDFTDLDNPLYDFDYLGTTLAIDHNGYTNGDDYYLANYTAGIRVLDLSQIENNTISEIGFFDTYPENDSAAFDGVWNIYPFFTSENIIISDIDRGLFIIRRSDF
jgi:choice-of-anchor B domain-containing protein